MTSIETLTANPIECRDWRTDKPVTRYRARRVQGTIETTRTDFGMVDNKGRRIGYIVHVCSIHFEPKEDSYSIWPREAFEDRWMARTRATRDGEGFGASTSEITAKTREALDRKVAARMEAARKRYAKNCR